MFGRYLFKKAEKFLTVWFVFISGFFLTLSGQSIHPKPTIHIIPFYSFSELPDNYLTDLHAPNLYKKRPLTPADTFDKKKNSNQNPEISGTKPNRIRLYGTHYIFSFREQQYVNHPIALLDFGVGYSRLFGKLRRHGIEALFDVNLLSLYRTDKHEPNGLGALNYREFYVFGLAHNFVLLRDGPISIESILGASLRLGSEVRAYSFYNDISYTLSYRDPGLIGGLNIEYRPWPSIHIYASSYFTGILWRYATQNYEMDHPFLWYLQQTPRSSWTLRVGIGYTLGKGLSHK